MGVLVAGLAVVLWVASRTRQRPEREVDPLDVVAGVAARHGCAPQRVAVDALGSTEDRLWAVTVHAPPGFPVDRFALDLQALAHNSGGRLDPQGVTESGGYGLARLEGRVGEERWRVLVLGDEPPPELGAAPVVRPAARPRLAVVLDDAGYSLDSVQEIERLPREVAVAVLPNTPHARDVAAALARSGREVLLHMPMEPVAGHGPGPGPGAIRVGWSREEVARAVDDALEVVYAAKGVNNHMGSRATADLATMRLFMAALDGRGLFFLDSRTTTETVAELAARGAGIPCLRRDVFLDVVDDPDAIRRALRDAVARARAQGEAVAIGHVHPVTIAVLAEDLPKVLGDVRLRRPSRLLDEEP